jgi:hypothetical protein
MFEWETLLHILERLLVQLVAYLLLLANKYK